MKITERWCPERNYIASRRVVEIREPRLGLFHKWTAASVSVKFAALMFHREKKEESIEYREKKKKEGKTGNVLLNWYFDRELEKCKLEMWLKKDSMQFEAKKSLKRMVGILKCVAEICVFKWWKFLGRKWQEIPQTLFVHLTLHIERCHGNDNLF